MKGAAKRFIIFFVIIIAIFGITFGIRAKENKNKGLFVTQWKNIYQGHNIKFYYDDPESQYMKDLVSKHKLNDVVKGEKDDLNKALKLKDWLNDTLEFNKGSVSGKENAAEILEALKDSKKASDKDFAITYTEVSRALGLYSRMGEFRAKDSQFSQKDFSLYVCEIWSKEHNKWIMLDVANNCYMEDKGTPLSALEVLNKGIQNVKIVGIDKPKKYISNMQKYLYSYSMPIANNMGDIKKSNTYITYIPEKDIPEIKVSSGYIPPTIFVNKGDLFNISPEKEYKDDQSDKEPTLVFLKKDLKKDKDGNLTFVVGASKNSVMLKEYYIGINGGELSKIDKYFDLDIKPGKNTVVLSEDGKNITNEVVIEYKK